jgi:hypothetical protein
MVSLLRYLYNLAPGEGKANQATKRFKAQRTQQTIQEYIKVDCRSDDHDTLGQWVPQRVQRMS